MSAAVDPAANLYFLYVNFAVVGVTQLTLLGARVTYTLLANNLPAIQN